ncbi:MAG: ABC transporter ATP-binding protein/permease [Lactobacillaceae bacterium]|jgi:ATP-binding cassette subfamily B protein AbcA/BmrA|nr:ABC transporter ATP-binding protein/permease [Lactobacillaceae bacterium]
MKSPVIRLVKAIGYNKWALFFGILFSVTSALSSILVPLELRKFVDGKSTLIGAITIGGLFLLQAIFAMLSFYILTITGNNFVNQLRKKIFSKSIHLSVTDLQKYKSAELTSHVMNDTDALQTVFDTLLPNLFTGTIAVLGSIVLMIVLSWQLTLAIIVALPVLGIILNIVSGSTRGFYAKVKEITARVSGQVSQFFLENKLIKSSNAYKNAEESIDEQFDSLNEQNRKIAVVRSLINPIVFMIIMMTLAIVFAYGGVLVSSKVITTGTLVAFLVYIFQIISPITSVGTMLNDWKSAEGSSEELAKLLENQPEQTGSKPLEGKINTIEFKDVSFAYDKKQVLKDLSLKIKPKQRVAFVGPSGGGKTTVINLLERFYSPDSGFINFGDDNIQEIDLTQWRQNISLVSQESAVISGTLRANLTLGLKDISDEQIWKALEESFASDFVHELEGGLDFVLSEGGANLSGGQLQRINIAREFLRNGSILILDEATASLDSESEQIIKKSIDKLSEGKIVISIAHRLSTIKDSDNIFFLEGGQIVASGKHSALMKKYEKYAHYVENQLL